MALNVDITTMQANNTDNGTANDNNDDQANDNNDKSVNDMNNTEANNSDNSDVNDSGVIVKQTMIMRQWKQEYQTPQQPTQLIMNQLIITMAYKLKT